MTETARQGESVYLRGWDDYEHHTLKLTASKTTECAIWPSARAARRRWNGRVAALKDGQYDIGWTDGDLGHGPAFAFHDPDGHLVEIYYETEWYQGAAGVAAGTEKSGAAFSGSRSQCPATRSSELPGGGHKSESNIF